MPTMRAVEVTAPGKFRFRTDVPVPTPGPGQVRIRVQAAGICGTDIHICKGDPSIAAMLKPPFVLGHEFCGEVESVGPGVTELRPGDRVAANSLISCERCEDCRRGAAHLCAERQVFGMNRPGNDNRQLALNTIHWLTGLLK